MNTSSLLPLALMLVAVLSAQAARESTPKGKAADANKKKEAYQWSEEPKTVATGAWLAHLAVEAEAQGRSEVAKGLSEMLGAANLSVPCAESGVYFFLKREGKEKQPSVYMRKGLRGSDERLIDASKVSGGKNAALRIADVSADGSLLVYIVREGKAEKGTVHFFDVNAREDLPEILPEAHYNTVSISPKKEGVYYTKVEKAGTQVFLHRFGTQPANDQLIFGKMFNYEPLGPNDLISAEVTDSEAYLIISVARGTAARRTDFYSQELAKPDERVRPIIHAMNNHFTAVNHGGDLYLLTDYEAPKKRVAKLIIDDPAPPHWVPIVPEGKHLISSIAIVGEKLFVSSPQEGAMRTRVFTLDGKEIGQLTTPAVDSALSVHHRCRPD